MFGKDAEILPASLVRPAVGSIMNAGAARRTPSCARSSSATFYGAAEIALGLYALGTGSCAIGPTGFGIYDEHERQRPDRTRTDPDKRRQVMALLHSASWGQRRSARRLAVWARFWSSLGDHEVTRSPPWYIALICGAWAMIHWKGASRISSLFPQVGVGWFLCGHRALVDPS